MLFHQIKILFTKYVSRSQTKQNRGLSNWFLYKGFLTLPNVTCWFECCLCLNVFCCKLHKVKSFKRRQSIECPFVCFIYLLFNFLCCLPSSWPQNDCYLYSDSQSCFREVCSQSTVILAEAVMFLLWWVGRFVCSDKNRFLMKIVMRKKLSRNCQMQMFWKKTRMRKWYCVLKVEVNFVCGFKVM